MEKTADVNLNDNLYRLYLKTVCRVGKKKVLRLAITSNGDRDACHKKRFDR